MFKAVGLECVKGYDSLFSGIDIELQAGQIIQITGTNGCGKTSLLRILTGLSQPEAGEIYWDGVNIDDDREFFNEQLLYIGHQNGLKSDLSALENLELMRRYLASCAAVNSEQALAEVGLSGYEPILAHQLSAGQKRRVTLARMSFSHAPLWILDEPITAIDIDGVEYFERTIEKHVIGGGMVIFTSHQQLTFGSIETHTFSLSAA